MNLRLTNSALLFLLAVLTVTGAYGLMWPFPGWLYEAHRLAGFALVALLPWKLGIALRSLGRGVDRRLDRSAMIGISLLLAAAVLAVLAFGILWAVNSLPRALVLGDTLISWHWMIAVGLVPFLALHVWRRWPKPKARELASRRAALRYLGWGALGVAGWGVLSYLAQAREDPTSPRAATGSREQGSFTGNAFPVTQSYGQGRQRVAADGWSFALTGAVRSPVHLSYSGFLERAVHETTATLDCTTGWYSTQIWRGVPLAALLDEAELTSTARTVLLISVEGYVAEFPLPEARSVFLATCVGGEVLDHWHGFPLRAVAPTRRGWQWVKWLGAVEVRASGVA